nr:hypothetical protein GCM10020093_097730 [Planobispora longispora]
MLIRAVQEALANVRKHAAASLVEVAAAYDADAVTLEIRDDGRGLDRRASGGSGEGTACGACAPASSRWAGPSP